MLLCQKTDLILGRSDSGRYAPELAGRKSTPPISRGSESASGVTTRFAPRDLNSSESRSPTSSETLSAAVATAMPSESAAAVRNLRRGRRVKLSAMRRRNMAIREQRSATQSWEKSKRTDLKFGHYKRPEKPPKTFGERGSSGHFGPGFCNCAEVDDEIGAVHAKWNANGIAAARLADCRNVNGGAAVAADDVLPILPVAFRATDAAGVERHAPALRLLDDQKAKRLISRLHRKKVQVAVLYFAEWDAQFVIPC